MAVTTRGRATRPTAKKTSRFVNSYVGHDTNVAFSLSVMRRIIVDAMGGDHGPGVVVAGALQAVDEYGVEITLVSQSGAVESELVASQIQPVCRARRARRRPPSTCTTPPPVR